MKKKMKDVTIKEIMDFCDKQETCKVCPLNIEGICIEGRFCPVLWDYIKGLIEVIEVNVD